MYLKYTDTYNYYFNTFVKNNNKQPAQPSRGCNGLNHNYLLWYLQIAVYDIAHEYRKPYPIHFPNSKTYL